MAKKKVDDIVGKAAKCVSDGVWEKGMPTPSIASLARRWEYSTTTINRALKILAEAGIVVKADQGNRYIVPPLPEPGVGGRRLMSSRTAHEMRRDILHGHFAGNGSMSMREIRARYHCSHYTAVSALTELVEEGLIVKSGKRYRRAKKHSNARTSAVYLVGPGHHLFSDPGLQKLVGGIEYGLHSLDWGRLETFCPEVGATPPEEHKVAGYIYVPHHVLVKRFRPFVTSPRIPTVLIDREGVGGFPFETGHASIVGIDNKEAARTIIQHFLETGRRRCAFFCQPGGPADWQEMRIKEIVRVSGQMNSANRNDGVRVFRGGLPEADKGPVRTGEARRNLRGMPDSNEMCERLPDKVVHTMIVHHSWHLRNLYLLARAMEPLFREALEDRSITGWICSNDNIAFMALKYLEKHGKRVPRDIAVAGFDNHPLAQVVGLTTYDLGYHQLGMMAVNVLANPEGRRGVSLPPPAKGFLVPRGSTAVPGVG